MVCLPEAFRIAFNFIHSSTTPSLLHHMQISRRGRLAAKPAPIVKCWMHTSLFNLESFGRPILLLVDYGSNVNIYDLITDNMAICLTMRLSSNASINSIFHFTFARHLSRASWALQSVYGHNIVSKAHHPHNVKYWKIIRFFELGPIHLLVLNQINRIVWAFLHLPLAPCKFELPTGEPNHQHVCCGRRPSTAFIIRNSYARL